jgi:hypothetical protein
MRTTLTTDNAVLAVAKAMAQRQHKSVGEAASALTRQALQPAKSRRDFRNGVPLLCVKPGSAAVTPELVNQLRDELP